MCSEAASSWKLWMGVLERTPPRFKCSRGLKEIGDLICSIVSASSKEPYDEEPYIIHSCCSLYSCEGLILVSVIGSRSGERFAQSFVLGARPEDQCYLISTDVRHMLEDDLFSKNVMATASKRSDHRPLYCPPISQNNFGGDKEASTSNASERIPFCVQNLTTSEANSSASKMQAAAVPHSHPWSPTTSLYQQKQGLPNCLFYMEHGYCCIGPSCKFLHPRREPTAMGVLNRLEIGEGSRHGPYKTDLCNNWAKRGECPYGERCTFAHGEGELRRRPSHPLYGTVMCRSVAQGKICPYGHKCQFRHN